MALSAAAIARILTNIQSSGQALTGGAVTPTTSAPAAPANQQPAAPPTTPVVGPPQSFTNASQGASVNAAPQAPVVAAPYVPPTPAASVPIPASNSTSTMPGIVQAATGASVTNPLGPTTQPVAYTNPVPPVPASSNASGNGLSDKTNTALQNLLNKTSPENPLIQDYSSPVTPNNTSTGNSQPNNIPIPTSNNTGQPVAQAGYGQLTQDQIRAEAAARIARDRAAITGAVNNFKTGVKNSYDYAQQITGDSRALQDGQLGRLKNPYSGGTDYQKAMLERNRGIQDTATDKDYQAQISQAEQKLLDFEALAPEQQQTIFNELQRQERDYGLSVGALTGYLGTQRTLAGQQFDYSQTRDSVADNQWQQNYDQNQSELDWNKNPANPAVKLQVWNANLAKQEAMNYPAQVKADLAKANQDLQAGKIDIDTANYQLEQFANPNSIYNQSQKVALQLSQLELSQTSEQGKLEVQKLRKQIADIGKVKPTTQAESEMDKAKLAKVNAEIAKIEADTQKVKNGSTTKSTTPTFENVSKYANGIARYKDGALLNPTEVEAAILSYDLTEAEYRNLYATYGLKWGG